MNNWQTSDGADLQSAPFKTNHSQKFMFKPCKHLKIKINLKFICTLNFSVVTFVKQ